MPRTNTNVADHFHFEGFDNPTTTPVPDVVFDRLMPVLSDGELRVLLYIMRRTFGFKKQSDNISIKQMVDGITTRDGKVLDYGTGASRASVTRALRGLTEKGIVVAQRNRSAKKGDEPTTYALRFREPTPVAHTETRGGLTQSNPRVSHRATQQTVRQETDNSNIREIQPQKQKTDEAEQGSTQLLPTQPTVSREEFERIQQQIHKPTPEQSSEDQPKPAGLTRHYLSAARSRATQQPKTHGLTSIAAVIPKPEPRKRTYSEERQVLVDVISDLAREFRDEATLTESVSRANNLMGKAGITDVGVFVSKMYEARAITKERYGTIKRRMPYFFSVLSNVCGLKPKSSTQNPRSE